MKCPHCNQEHPDDYQFCPKTGKKIELLKACTKNPSCPDHGKYIWPPDTQFCPRCGAKLEEKQKPKDEYVFNPRKKMSSVEDFRHGNIVIDSIILGRTSASELEKFKDEYSDDSYCELLDESVHVYGGLSLEQMKRILEINKQSDSQLISAMRDRVYDFSVYECNKIQFLKEIGFNEHDDDDNIVKLFESNGYVRIEPPVISEEWKEKLSKGLDIEGLYFISLEPNAYGNHVLISRELFGPLTIRVNWLREWTTYYDGVKHTI